MRPTKSLSAALCLAIAGALGSVPPASAQAPGAVPVQAGAQVTAVTTADLNARSGPSTGYPVLFVIPRGATVTVQGCNQPITWCSVLYGGRAGWSSAAYLRATQNQQPIPNAGAALGIAIFNFIAGAIARELGVAPAPPPGPPAPPPGPDPVACFFDGGGYGGAGFCLERGDALRSLPAEWDDRITSIRIDPGLTVEVCRNPSFGGWCEVFTTSVPYLPSNRDNAISSVRVL